MGKLTALIVGYISITFAAYVILSVSYNPLINWLGPYFGYHFPLILGIIYLVAGSPLKNTIILEIWVIIGILVGVSARKGTKAWGSATLLWLSTTITLVLATIAMLGISIFSITNLGAISSAVTGIPATFIAATAFVPYGTNIGTIATEPILRTIFPYISSSLSSGSSGTGSITPLLKQMGMNILENYLIFVVTSILVGFIFHRVLHGKKRKSTKAVAAALSIFIAFIFIAMAASGSIASDSSTPSIIGAPVNHDLPALGESSLFPISISNGSAHIEERNDVVPYASPAFSSSQAALSLITPQGNLYNLFAMENSNTGTLWSSNGLIFGSVAITANMTSLIESEYGINYGDISALAPQNVLILGYSGSGHSAAASNLASSIGNHMKTKFVSIFTLKNITLGNDHLSIYLYTSESSNNALKSGFMSAFDHNSVPGIPAIFNHDEGLNNYTAYAMASGYINGSIVKSITGNIGLNLSTIEFTAGLFKYSNHFHSSGDAHTYNLASLMFYNSPISFTSSSTLYIAGIGYDNTTGNIADNSKYIFSVDSNNASLVGKTPLNTTGSSIKHETSFSPSAISVSFNEIFPAYIQYSTTVDRISDNRVEIHVYIKNNDNEDLKDLNISQSAFVNHYVKYNASKFISGNYNTSNKTLAPGKSISLMYNISLSGVGVYVMPYTNISYNFQDKAFSYQTNATYIAHNKPEYVYAMNSMVNSEASQFSILGTIIVTVHSFAFSLIDVILALIVALDVVIEVKAFKKYRNERNSEK